MQFYLDAPALENKYGYMLTIHETVRKYRMKDAAREVPITAFAPSRIKTAAASPIIMRRSFSPGFSGGEKRIQRFSI